MLANNLNVYTKDFDIERGVTTYYRFPKDIDIDGYVRIDGTASTNIDPEGTDCGSIKLYRCVPNCSLGNYSDVTGIEINKDRIIVNN